MKEKKPLKLYLKKKYSFYTTEEILDTYAEYADLPSELIKDMYYQYIDTLLKEGMREDIVAYRLGSFGTITISAPGANHNILNGQKRFKKNNEVYDTIKLFEGKKKKVESLLKEYFKKDKITNKTPLLKKARPINQIKNE